MDEGRRKLLGLGALTAVSAVLPREVFGEYLGKHSATPIAAGRQSATPVPAGREYDALSYLKPDDFKPSVGTVFKVESGASTPVSVILAEVQSPPTLAGSTSTTGAPDQQTFALRFKSISGGALKQGTYIFQSSTMGSFAMFVAPSAPGALPVYYTGQVNRSV